MKYLFLFSTIAIVFFTQACKKIDVEPEEGIPVFSAEFMVDGKPVFLEGGVGDYYMFTSFEKDETDVYSFNGKMALGGCGTSLVCGEFLEIQIRDFQQVPPNQLDLNEALSNGGRLFISPAQGLDSVILAVDEFIDYKVDLFADSNFSSPAFPDLFNWNIADSIFISGGAISFVFDELIPAPKVVLERLVLNGGDSCVVTQTQYISEEINDRCHIYIVPLLDGSTVSDLVAFPGGNFGPGGWIWNDDPMLSDSLLGDSLLLDPGDYFASVALQPGGCESSATFYKNNTVSPNMAQACVANFEYTVEELITSDTIWGYVPNDSLNLEKVNLTYSDGLTEYSSDKFSQPGNSFFEIINVEDFDDNENGFPTKVITLRFKCMVWNDSNEPKEIASTADVIWGVAYPQ